ncbi:MAG: FHA domain-containing protein [Phycisphaerae bacterium]|nr:FHA domain-containing protein [Planctomycetota bacterium]MBL7218617.1 FHA domain-containing protein [Phycisphaerae bacterium]
MAAGRAELVYVKGPQAGQRASLMSAVVTVGRGQQADVQLTEEHVSRKHFQLTLTRDGWVFENISALRSRVNGKKYKTGKKIILDTGDIIAAGSETELLFVATGDDTEAAVIAYRQSGARKGKSRSATAAPAVAVLPDQQIEPDDDRQPGDAEPSPVPEDGEESELDSEELAELELKAQKKKYGIIIGVYLAVFATIGLIVVTTVERRGPRGRAGRPALMNREQIESAVTAKLQRDRNPVEAGRARDKALLALDSTHKVDYLYRGLYWFKLSRAYGGVLNTEDERRFRNASKSLTEQVQEKYFNACAYEGDHKYKIAFDLFQRLLNMLPTMGRQDAKNEFRKNIRAHMAYINRTQAVNTRG